MFGGQRRRYRGRRLVDGQLVDDDGPFPRHSKRKIYYGRLIVIMASLFFLIRTNPANRPFFSRSRLAWSKSTLHKQQMTHQKNQQQQIDWKESWNRLYRAYQILASEEDDDDDHDPAVAAARDDTTDTTLVNYLLFSVRETKKRRLQVMGAGRMYTCKITHSYTCRKLRDILLPTSPIRRNNKKQEQLEQLLLLEPLHKRRYFMAYRMILALVLVTLIITLVMPSLDDDDWEEHPPNVLAEAWSRGFWPNPHTPFSSALVTFCDVWLFLAPALAVMDVLVTNQSPQSFFALLSADNSGNNKHHHHWNYAFSVLVFLLAASSANLPVMTDWGDLLGAATSQRTTTRPRPRRLPRSGYSSDVWAACALGYLRACKDPDYSFLLSTNDWQGVRLSVAIWIRVAVQLFVVSGISFSSIGLWLTADALGYFIGDYQVQHHFINQMVGNLWQGLDRFFTSLFGPAF